MKADLATKDCIKELKDIITVKKPIDELESKMVIMEQLIENLREDNDDTQQYQMRLCLRIGVPVLCALCLVPVLHDLCLVLDLHHLGL